MTIYSLVELVDRFGIDPADVASPAMVGTRAWVVSGKQCVVRLQPHKGDDRFQTIAVPASAHARSVALRVRGVAVPRILDVCKFRLDAASVPLAFRVDTAGVAVSMERAAGEMLTTILRRAYNKRVLAKTIQALAVFVRALYRSTRRLVHGDLHCGNVFYSRRTVTVLDWECASEVMSGIDSRRDLAQFLVSTVDVLGATAPRDYIEFVAWAIKATPIDRTDLEAAARGDGDACERLWARASTRRTSKILRCPFVNYR